MRACGSAGGGRKIIWLDVDDENDEEEDSDDFTAEGADAENSPSTEGPGLAVAEGAEEEAATVLQVEVRTMGGDVLLESFADPLATILDLKRRIARQRQCNKRAFTLVVGGEVARARAPLADALDGAVWLVTTPTCCRHCGSERALRRCDGCDEAYYCRRRSCQWHDWQRHRAEDGCRATRPTR